MLETIRKILASRAKRLAAFAGREDGTAAVEFAIVAAPFLAMTFAIMETALVFFAGQTLETAVADSSRLIMTGQAQTQGFDQNQFKQAVCDRLHGLFSCGGVMVDVQQYTSFANAKTNLPVDQNGN